MFRGKKATNFSTFSVLPIGTKSDLYQIFHKSGVKEHYSFISESLSDQKPIYTYATHTHIYISHTKKDYSSKMSRVKSYTWVEESQVIYFSFRLFFYNQPERRNYVLLISLLPLPNRI